MAPMIRIQVSDHEIIIADNGPGIPAETVGIRDFSVRVSSLEAYAFLARGAQATP
jgi:DNA topoisomerase VI subunit B